MFRPTKEDPDAIPQPPTGVQTRVTRGALCQQVDQQWAIKTPSTPHCKCNNSSHSACLSMSARFSSRYTASPAIALSIRLCTGQRAATVTHSIGTLPEDMELVLRIVTEIATADAFETDNNRLHIFTDRKSTRLNSSHT